MTKADRNGIMLKGTTVIAVVGIIGAGIAAYFNGIAEGKEYVDYRIYELRNEQTKEIKELKKEVHKSRIDIEVIRKILEHQYGRSYIKDRVEDAT